MSMSVARPGPDLASRILLVRGRRVLLSQDLAALYGVPTKALNQQVRRNRARFPSDFMFALTGREMRILRSQIVTSSSAWGGRRYRPLAFTEQGVAMLSSVLASERAIRVNIAIMRAFVRIREYLSTHEDIARKLLELEERFEGKFATVFDAIRQIIEGADAPEPRKLRIGFQRGVSAGPYSRKRGA